MPSTICPKCGALMELMKEHGNENVFEVERLVCLECVKREESLAI